MFILRRVKVFPKRNRLYWRQSEFKICYVTLHLAMDMSYIVHCNTRVIATTKKQ